MGQNREGILHIKQPTIYHTNFGIELSGKEEMIERFNELCYREFNCSYTPTATEEKRSYRAFWQGQTKGWLYIEFWMDRTPENWEKVSKKATQIADELHIPLASEAPREEW